MDTAVRSLDGTLDDFPIEDVVRLLAATGQTGALTVGTSPPMVLWFSAGRLVLAARPGAEEVDSALIASGAATPAQLAVVRRDLGESLIRLRPALAAAGADYRSTTEVLYDITVERVFELLLPTSARFWFDAVADARLVEDAYCFDRDRVLADANQRLDAWRRIAEVIPSTAVVVRLAEQLPPTVEWVSITREEWPILAAVDGRRNITDIIDATGLSAFGVCGVLHRLLLQGVIETVLSL